MDVGMSLWLPGGELGEYRGGKEQRTMVDTVLEVGAVRYEMLEALQSWRLTTVTEVQARARACGASQIQPVHVALDVRFDAVTPAIGTDGQPSGGPQSAEAAAAAGTVGKGHLEQAGRWTGGIRSTARATSGSARTATAIAPGARADGAARGCGGGSPSTSTRTSTSAASGSAPRPATSTAAGCGTATRTSVGRVDVTTELAEDGVDPACRAPRGAGQGGPQFRLRGDVLRVADIGRAGGTMVNEGLARWTYEDPDGAARTGYGICEYLHQLDAAGRPVVAVE